RRQYLGMTAEEIVAQETRYKAPALVADDLLQVMSALPECRETLSEAISRLWDMADEERAREEHLRRLWLQRFEEAGEDVSGFKIQWADEQRAELVGKNGAGSRSYRYEDGAVVKTYDSEVYYKQLAEDDSGSYWESRNLGEGYGW
ncbi:hypothetical protein D6833_08670, partial [Candidatus Parcubacteria bacterium]